MRYKGLDLNLLIALDALLDEQSVSRAAERLHISQPAMSAALGRLRTHLDDPVLIAHGKRMVPSPQALRIKPLLSSILADIDAMVLSAARFDPATSNRRFRIGTSDYLMSVIYAPLMARLAREAPGVGLQFLQPADEIVTMLDKGELDMLILPDINASLDHPCEPLFEEEFVVAGWSGNPVFAAGMTLEAFSAAGHVAVELGRVARASFAETHLRQLGIPRRIELIASSFLVVPELLVGTQRLALMHERLARQAAQRFPIQYAALPFDFPRMNETVQYHRTRHDDPGLRWLIGVMQDGARAH